MKLGNLLLLLFLLIPQLGFTQSSKKIKSKSKEKTNQYQIVSIAFWNFENLYDTINDPNKDDDEFLPNGTKKYTGEIYRDKLSKLSEVISLLATEKTPDGPAIIGTAEIENVQVLEDLCKYPTIAARGYKPILVEGPDRRGVDPGLLYNPKYFTPIKSVGIYVPIMRDGDTSYTRDILYVKGVFMNEMTHIFVNHWPSRRGGEDASAPLRAKAASICKAHVDSITDIDPNAKVIVMGDLNDDPMSPSVTKFLNAHKDIEHVNEGEMYNPFCNFYQQGLGTLAWQDAWNLFDQIILSPGFVNKEQSGFFFNSAEVFNRPFLVSKLGNFKGYPFRTYVGDSYQGGYSDHFPVITYYVKKLPKVKK